MNTQSYRSDPLFLVERHVASTKKILQESCQGLNRRQTIIVEGIYNEFLPLIRQTALLEQTLTADEIKQLFADVEKNATASGENRSALGKGKDVVSKANQIINNIGKWLQDTAPVKAADEKFEQLKSKVASKFPDLDNQLTAMGSWMKENPGKSAAVIGVLTALAALGGGPVGGAIAGQVLRGAAELIKGEKLSTAVGKGVKTAAFGFLAGKAFEMLGDWLGGLRADIVMQDQYADVSWNATKKISMPGIEWTKSIQGVNVQVLPDDAETINFLMKTIEKGGGDAVQAFDKLAMLAKEFRTDDYKQLLIDVGAMARDNDSLYQWIETAKDGLQSMSQGAAAGAGMDNKKNIPQEALIYNLKPLSEAQASLLFRRISETNRTMIQEGVIWEAGQEPQGQKPSFMQKVMGKASEFGKNLTTKVTASKLMSEWKKAGSPADSDALAEFLEQQGVNQQVVADTFAGMQLPPPGQGRSMAEIAAIKQEIGQLGPKTQQQLADFLSQRLGAA